MARRVLREEGETSTVDDNRSRIKSAGRHASSTSAVEEVSGVIYCKDCLNCSILQLVMTPKKIHTPQW
jgi:hypothetical protein